MPSVNKLDSSLTNTEQANTECAVCLEILESGKNSKPPQLSQRGVILLGLSGAVFAGVSAIMVPFVIPGLRRFALPYIPASHIQVNNVMRALTGRSGSLIDIGSGDGRVVSTLCCFQRLLCRVQEKYVFKMNVTYLSPLWFCSFCFVPQARLICIKLKFRNAPL